MPETKVPAIKNIPAKTDPETKLALESIKEAVEVRLGRRGDPIDRAVTLRELIESGLATQLAQSPYNPNTGATGFGPISELPGDVEVPPTPINLRAETLFKDIALFWHTSRSFNPPYGNHASTEIWRSQTEDLSSAIAAGPLAGGVGGFSYTDTSTEYDRTYYYWVRYISTKGVPGPWSNMASATTVEDIGATMRLLSEELSNLPGYNLLQTGATAATIIKSSGSPSARPNGDALQLNDIWFDTDDGQIYTRNAANNAWVAARDATLVSVFGTTSFTGSTLSSAMATAQSNIVTVTEANSARVSEITSLEAITNGFSSSSTIAAAINTEATARASADSASATLITNLSASVGSGNDSGGAAYSASNTIVSHVNATDANAAAAYVLKVEANGAVAGMVLEANASGSGTGSAIQFQADKFAIWDSSGSASSNSVAPFIVDSGVVYIDTARIKNASIASAKIGSVNADTITTGTLNVADLIDANALDADKITAGTIGVRELAANFITANEINSDTITANDLLSTNTLNVKHFDNVSTDIKSHLSAGTFFPLGRSAQNFIQRSGTHTGSDGSFVPVTITEIRNGATYIAIFSGVLGNVSGGVVQYSLNNSTWVNASGNTNIYWNAGTYRGYTYVYTGGITGLSTSQSTVYWRVYFSGSYNHTQLSLNIIMDNTQ